MRARRVFTVGPTRCLRRVRITLSFSSRKMRSFSLCQVSTSPYPSILPRVPILLRRVKRDALAPPVAFSEQMCQGASTALKDGKLSRQDNGRNSSSLIPIFTARVRKVSGNQLSHSRCADAQVLLWADSLCVDYRTRGGRSL